MSNIRIIHANRKGSKQRCRIEWPDGLKAGEPEQNGPKQVIDTYLKSYTKVGRKRKHKPKYKVYFTKPQEYVLMHFDPTHPKEVLCRHLSSVFPIKPYVESL